MNTTATRLYAGQLDKPPKGREGLVLWNFYSSIFVARLARSDTSKVLREVIVTQSDDDAADYFAWWDIERQEFAFVFYTKGLVAMCFTYGPEAEEERGRGKLMAVDVEILRVVPPDEPDEQGRKDR